MHACCLCQKMHECGRFDRSLHRSISVAIHGNPVDRSVIIDLSNDSWKPPLINLGIWSILVTIPIDLRNNSWKPHRSIYLHRSRERIEWIDRTRKERRCSSNGVATDSALCCCFAPSVNAAVTATTALAQLPLAFCLPVETLGDSNLVQRLIQLCVLNWESRSLLNVEKRVAANHP